MDNTKEEILNEWLRQTDQSNIKEGHRIVILQAMEEYAELVKNHGVSHHVIDRTICKECQKKAIIDMMKDAEENDMYDL
jgi:hypothetical protein